MEWSLWRPKLNDGVWYSAAYHDGDSSVKLFTSSDGATWSAGPDVYTISADTPLETELMFMPSGALLALVRMDGDDQQLLGTDPAGLRTKVCWAQPPYDTFNCPDELDGQRLDGPLSFFWKDRLFVVARKHLGEDGRKRTSLFEITGDFTGAGKLTIQEWGELPSAGDTSYAGAAVVDDHRVLLSWYSGDLVLDQTWAIGLFDASDIWLGTVDFLEASLGGLMRIDAVALLLRGRLWRLRRLGAGRHGGHLVVVRPPRRQRQLQGRGPVLHPHLRLHRCHQHLLVAGQRADAELGRHLFLHHLPVPAGRGRRRVRRRRELRVLVERRQLRLRLHADLLPVEVGPFAAMLGEPMSTMKSLACVLLALAAGCSGDARRRILSTASIRRFCRAATPAT